MMAGMNEIERAFHAGWTAREMRGMKESTRMEPIDIHPRDECGRGVRQGQEVRVRPVFAWYDLWVGVYWDREARRLYMLPFPMVGVVFDFGRRLPEVEA